MCAITWYEAISTPKASTDAAKVAANTVLVEANNDPNREIKPPSPPPPGVAHFGTQGGLIMSRRRRAEPRIVKPDPRYNNAELAKFINRVMLKGKKSTAQRVVYDALELVRQDSNQDPMGVFSTALRNATPLVEVRPRRVGGATYQVPVELRTSRSEALAMRWIIRGARGRNGMRMARGLANEFMDAARGEGSAVRRKDELHRMAEANRAFVHYRR